MATSSEKASDHRDTMRAMRPSAPAGIFHMHGRLHITLHASEEVTVDAIQANPRHFYFSSNAAKVRRTLEQRRHSSHTHRPLMFCPQLLRIRRKDFSSASLCALWKIDPMLLSRIPTRHDHGDLTESVPLPCLQMYAPYCRDFGPIIMPIVVEFCEHVAKKMDHPLLQGRKMIFFMDQTAENVTNNVFLLCAVRACSTCNDPKILRPESHGSDILRLVVSRHQDGLDSGRGRGWL